MEWKTTTGGDTILHLEDHERDSLMMRAATHGDLAMAEALKCFDSTRRQHPHVGDFAKILDLAFPLTVPSGMAARTRVNADAAGGNAKVAKPSNPYAETLEIEKMIRKRLERSSWGDETSAGVQANANLLMALAVVNQTRVLGAKLDLLASDGVWKATQGRKDA